MQELYTDCIRESSPKDEYEEINDENQVNNNRISWPGKKHLKVEECKYLGQTISASLRLRKTLRKKLKTGWSAPSISRHKPIMTSNLQLAVK